MQRRTSRTMESVFKTAAAMNNPSLVMTADHQIKMREAPIHEPDAWGGSLWKIATRSTFETQLVIDSISS